MKLTAVSLFSGIGGFELAAEANGFAILCQVEIDERCRRFLGRHWPGVPKYGDIREFPAHEYRGATLVMGGPPCQPVSCAGKRRGEGDDRFLWKEALAVVEVIKPRWCLFENPTGILTMGFDGICSELEGQGYEVGTVVLPACAVNSPHIRQRVWIVGHSRRKPAWCEGKPEQLSDYTTGSVRTDDQGHMADTGSTGSLNAKNSHQAEQNGDRENGGIHLRGARLSGQWDSYLWTPCADGKLRRAPDDSFGLVDGLHRSVLASLGNSIVPQVAYQVIKAIVETELTHN